jgi:acetyltransferase-like isoleucine patch superfamily enzyme
MKYFPVSIGSNVWIGANVTILAGVHIATGTVVAAGSVVSKSIETADTIVAGVPARFLKMRLDLKRPTESPATLAHAHLSRSQ